MGSRVNIANIAGGLGINLGKNPGQTGVGSFLRNNAGLLGAVGGNSGGAKAGAVVGSAVGGPIGGAIGNVAGGVLDKTLGSYFSSFKQGGFRCLGKQAFNQGDLQRALQNVQARIDATNQNDGVAVANLLTSLDMEASYNNFVYHGLKSKCSKDNTMSFVNTLRDTINGVLKGNEALFNIRTQHHNDGKNVYDYRVFEYVGYGVDRFTVGDVPIPENAGQLTTGDIKNMFGGNLQEYSHLLTPGVVDSSVETGEYEPVGVFNKLTGEYEIEPVELVAKNNRVGVIIDGQSGDVSYGVQFGKGKRQDDDLLRTIMLIGLGLMGYKIFIK